MNNESNMFKFWMIFIIFVIVGLFIKGCYEASEDDSDYYVVELCEDLSFEYLECDFYDDVQLRVNCKDRVVNMMLEKSCDADMVLVADEVGNGEE